jgi:hypothetical protein
MEKVVILRARLEGSAFVKTCQRKTGTKHTGHVLEFNRKLAQLVDDDGELREEEIETIAEENEICVVGNIARSSTPGIIPVSKCA